MENWIDTPLIVVAVLAIAAALLWFGAWMGSVNTDRRQFKAFMEEMRRDMGELRRDIRAILQKLSSLEEKVSALGDKLSALEARVSSLEDKVSVLEDKVSVLGDKVSVLDAREPARLRSSAPRSHAAPVEEPK